MGFLIKYQENVRTAMVATDTVEKSDIRDALPASVYLRKGDSFSFGVMMILDSSLPAGECFCNILHGTRFTWIVVHARNNTTCSRLLKDLQ